MKVNSRRKKFMIRSRSVQTATSVMMLVGLMGGVSAPLVLSRPAQAQLLGNQYVTIPLGTVLPMRYDKAQKIVVAPTETVPLSLTLASNVRTSNGTILIPVGSQIVGDLKPVEGGSQFIGKELLFTDGRRQLITADSGVINKTQEVKKGGDLSSILQGAAIGSGAAAIISGVTGNKKITVGKVLIGAGVGALGGWLLGNKKTDVIVINPNTDLDITLRSDLALR
jgi:hypothetical protein